MVLKLKPLLTIPQLIDDASLQYGELNAIEDESFVLSYNELNEARLNVAASLIAVGVEPGDKVAIWAPNIWEWIVAATALQTVGAALVPLNTRMKGAEAAFVLAASGAKVLFSIAEFLGVDYPQMLSSEHLPELKTIVSLRGASDGCVQWDDFLELGHSIARDDVLAVQAGLKPETTSDLLFTSGTTGKPKGVVTAHGQNLAIVCDWSDVVGLRQGDRYLIVNPFFHSFGYKAGWLAALMRGCTILPHQVFDVPSIMSRIGEERITVLPGPPTLYQSILAHPERHKFDISSLRVAVTGAAAIPVEMIQRMRDELGFEVIITAYGLTEVCGFATICRAGDPAEIVATTSGRAMPGIEVICVDDKGVEVPRGEAGEVVVKGYNVMQGYFNNEEATQEAIDQDGWLHTGDIGIMDQQGYLRITDRMKDMFITGGFNVYPAEIENILSTHPDVAQASVVGIPEERLGEVAVAFILPLQGRAMNSAEVIKWCREKMANYKVPRHVIFVESLPLNASGKVMKFELRDRAVADLS